MLFRSVTTIAVISTLYLYQPMTTEDRHYARSFPESFAGWITAADIPADHRTIELLETKDILMRNYRQGHGPAVLLALVASTSSNRKITHPPEICYRGQGWEILQKRQLRLAGGIPAILLLIHKDQRQRAVLYWYKFGQSYTTNYYYHQAQALFNFFSRQQGGVALIRLSTAIDHNPGESIRQLQRFAEDALPLLSRHLP